MSKFYAARGEDGPFFVGPCETEAEVLAEAQNEFDPEDEIFIGKSSDITLYVDADSLLEMVSEAAYDELYEDALDMWCVKVPSEKKEELGQRLTEVLHKWLEENNQKHTFAVINAVERTPPTKAAE